MFISDHNNITIRKATPTDCYEIANVHINSWREAYSNFLPKSYLDSRPLAFKSKAEMWSQNITNESQSIFVAECETRGIIGFISGSKGRERRHKDKLEVRCLYLFQKYHGQKIGFRLLQALFDTYHTLGFNMGYLWVLKDNPTISFYQKVGGQYNGNSKTCEIEGQLITEDCYFWNSLSGLKSKN
ncbi:MAG: GNAT family N-acetyltransferase [Candidatus Cloacimonetes bacterium]|nr:GNAT family N-acetyltransferase [Candidatus Cloacimonadota bacterium]